MSSIRLSLFRRANGVYYIHYRKHGRAHWVSTRSRSKVEALRVLTEFKKQHHTDGHSRPLSQFTDQFHKYAISIYSPGTVTIYTSALKQFQAVVGDVSLSTITSRHVDQFKAERFKATSPPTVNIDLRTLRAAFNTALRWKMITENPFTGVKQVPTIEQYPCYFSKEDFQKLLSVIREGWLRDIVLFAVLTGMRRGEILNLCWQQVDFGRRLIYLQSGPTFRTKRGKKRIVPLNDTAVHVLKGRQTRSVGDLVFMLNDKPIYQDWVSAKLKKYIRTLGLDPRLHFHSLRHTFASWLVQDGVSIYEVQKLLGHSSIAVTQVYSHLQPESLHATVNRLRVTEN